MSDFEWYKDKADKRAHKILKLEARIAELEAALRMNLDASSDVQWDEPIDAMRGRLQSIRAKSIHALKKAGDHD